MKDFDELDWEDKELFLHEYLKNKNYSEISDMLSNSNNVTKCDIIEILGEHTDIPEITSIISLCLTDNDFVVRCQAVEALSNSTSKDIFGMLLNNFYKEKSSVVKGYYSSAIMDICRRMPSFGALIDKNSINRLYGKEKSPRGKIAFNLLLYFLDGDISFVEDTLKFLDHSDYRIRCSAINSLSDIIDKKNYRLINDALKERAKKEKAESVLSSLRLILGRL